MARALERAETKSRRKLIRFLVGKEARLIARGYATCQVKEKIYENNLERGHCMARALARAETKSQIKY